ncbi:MAG TPA: hypothetical protein VF746_12500 [Longimicrobium sp.]|jgi:hypothetical protein
MKKLKLDIDALKVDTFEASVTLPQLGTVHGLVAHTSPDGCGSLDGCPMTVVGSEPGVTCQLECTGSCGYTYCAFDCPHGQSNGDTCACASAVTCAPDPGC